MIFLIKLLIKTIDFYSFLIIISIIGSWIDPMGSSKVFQYVRKLTDPYLKLFKIVIPLGSVYIDISAVIGLLILNLIRNLLIRKMFFIM